MWYLIFLSILLSFLNNKIQCGEIKTIPIPYLNEEITLNDDIYFLEFNSVSNEEECWNQHSQFKSQVSNYGYEWLIRREFCTLFNGISFHSKEATIHYLVGMKEVKAIWPMISKRLPQFSYDLSKRPTNPLENHIITGVSKAQDQLKLDGTGIKVGIIDTGIDYLHPYLGGCFKGEGCRVQYGKDLVGDEYDGTNLPIPDEDPRDTCGGHGTHVAGIIGAKGEEFVGVAPNVTFGAYKVFGCGPNSRVESDVIIEALEMAFKDGMDIINLSLGGGSAWSEYPDSVVADKLSSMGIVIVAAAGNDGERGLFEVASPAIGSKVISVASFDSERYVARAFMLDHLPLSKLDYTIAPNSPRFNFTNIPITLSKDKDMLGCYLKDMEETKDKILVVKRGECPFEKKAQNAQKLGAKGMIIINNNPGTFTPLIKQSLNNEITIPIIGLSTANGNLLLNQSNKTEEIKITTPSYFINSNGGKVSSFSSWGPGPELEIKPDLGAPGGQIFSTFPIHLGMYATLSGTSMATPYTSGMISLFLQSKKEVNNHFNLNIKANNELKTKLFNNAQPKLEKNSLPISVLRQGSGMVDIFNAIQSKTIITPSKITLNNTLSAINNSNSTELSSITPIIHIVQIKNESINDTFNYELSHLPSPSITNYENKEFLSYPKQKMDLSLQLKFNLTKFNLLPKQTQFIQIEFIPPTSIHSSSSSSSSINQLDNHNYDFLSGYIQVQHNQTDLKPYHIPYLALIGNYTQLPILNITEYPKLILNRNDSQFNSTSNTNSSLIVTFQNKDYINLKVRVEHPTRMLYIKAVDPLTQNELGYIKGGINHYISRNDMKPTNLYYNFPFNGVILIPKVNSTLSGDSNNSNNNNSNEQNPTSPTTISSSSIITPITDNNENSQIPDLYGVADGANTPSDYITKNLIEGQVVLKVMALKPFGDPKNLEDFQIWYSPIITISKMNVTEIK